MKSLITHNQGLCAAIIVTIAVFAWTFGCQSKVNSLVTNEKVTRPELTLELKAEAKRLEQQLDNLRQEAELRFMELDRQDEIKAKIFDAVSVATEAGSFNAAGLITLVGSILGIGAVVDNRIKDKVIANRPLNNGNPVAT